MMCGASIAYGLTDGGPHAERIALTELGRRIVAPTKEGDDSAARREALLRPRVVRDFLTRYNDSKLPSLQIAKNVLEELGVPQNKTEEVFKLIEEGARDVGLGTVDPKLIADQMGHNLDVSQNIYTVPDIARRREAVNLLETAVQNP